MNWRKGGGRESIRVRAPTTSTFSKRRRRPAEQSRSAARGILRALTLPAVSSRSSTRLTAPGNASRPTRIRHGRRLRGHRIVARPPADIPVGRVSRQTATAGGSSDRERCNCSVSSSYRVSSDGVIGIVVARTRRRPSHFATRLPVKYTRRIVVITVRMVSIATHVGRSDVVAVTEKCRLGGFSRR